ncbi:regulatory protein UhpC [Vibrio cholerae]|nr:regulatory protein UhpC [Vibrio cholerae]
MKIVPMVQPIQGMEIDQAYRHWRIHRSYSLYSTLELFWKHMSIEASCYFPENNKNRIKNYENGSLENHFPDY